MKGRMKNGVSNKKFAEENEIFKASIEKAKERGEKVEATGRQASKFRNKKEIAYCFSKSLPKKKVVIDEKTI